MVQRKFRILYTADIYRGFIYTLDVSDPKNIAVLDSTKTPLAHRRYSVHNAWSSEDKQWLFVTEEANGSGISVFDISEPRHPKIVTTYRSAAVHENSIAHNVVVRGDTAYVAWYTEGVRLIDISDPRNPKEVGYFDTSSESPVLEAMQGNWSVWPDSQGFVLASDMQSSLFILRPIR